MLRDALKGMGTRLQALLHRRTDANELDEELRFHLDNLIARYKQNGLSATEADRRARIDLGHPANIKEKCQDRSGVTWLENLTMDAGLAFRTLRKAPVFALAAIFTLALGIGLNTALFTVLYSVVFRPLPVANPGQLWNLYMELTRANNERRSSYGSQYFESFPEFSYLQRHVTTADLAGIFEADLSPRDLSTKSLHAQLVSSNLLSMLGAYPAKGRFFLPGETDRPGSSPVVVLSHSVWRDQFGSDPSIVGRVVTMNRTPFTIIGVANQQFRGPFIRVPDIWIPITMQALTRPGESLVDNPTSAFIQIFGRNRAAFSDASIRAELSVLGQQSVAAHGSSLKARMHKVPAALLNYPDVIGLATPVLAVVWLLGGLVLLVACANVANLMLARGLSRRREIAIRLSIGAGRSRLVRQLLTESLLLGLAGGTVGVLLAWRLGSTVLKLIPGRFGQLEFNVTPDPLVLSFAVSISLVAAIACGLLPAFHALRIDLTPSLKSEGLLDTRTAGGLWLQNTLVAVQVAVSIILLVTAGLMTRGFFHAVDLDTGRDLHGLLVAGFDLRQQQYSPERAAAFHKGLEARLAGNPAIQATSVSISDPDLTSNGSTAWPVAPNGKEGTPVRVSFDEVGPDYFRTAGIRILLGRPFTAAEVSSKAQVVLIDEHLSRIAFDGQPLGKYLSLGPDAADRFQVIGVAAATKTLAPGRTNLPWYYAPLLGIRFMEAKLWVRYQGSSQAVTQAVYAAARQEDPEVTVRTHTAEENVETALMPIRIASWAASALGILALLVAAIGLYGVISFAVSRRLRELGIRLALGARRSDLLWLVFGQISKPVGIGSAVGIAAAIALGFVLKAVLYGVSPMDPLALASVSVGLLVTGLLAAFAPARRAIRVDPATVLRNE